MRIGSIEVKRRVWVGLGCAVVVTAAWWAWSRGTQLVAKAPLVGPRPFVRLVGVDQVLRERADLHDPTPLFFPTEWNYGQRELPKALRRQPDQVFGSFEPKFTYLKDQDLKIYGVEATQTSEKLADILVQGNKAPFAGMGHVDAPPMALAERSAFVEVRSLSGDKPILAQSLTGFTAPRPDYAPIEFIVAVSAAGLIADPVLAVGSGWEEVDAFFRSYLVKTFRLGERLSPGRYRVLVGP